MLGTKRRYTPEPPADSSVFSFAAALILLVPVGMGSLYLASQEAYFFSVQEDAWLEWATVWAFALAAGQFLREARNFRRMHNRFPWFLIGLAIFCLVVALEEISWGQRIFGYRPPAYFLANNEQQEFNYHNLINDFGRRMAVYAVTIGYGVVLPLLALMPKPRALLNRIGIVPPPLALILPFLAAALLFGFNPLGFTSEVVELMLGLGFAFTAFQPGRAMATLTIAGAVVLAGALTAFASRSVTPEDPDLIRTARLETEALGRDLIFIYQHKTGGNVTNCGLHHRIHTWVTQFKVPRMHNGAFASLTGKGMPEDRAKYFIDPWNSPYWIHHACSRDGRQARILIYSFGPNRRRDSTRARIQGDDIGIALGANR